MFFLWKWYNTCKTQVQWCFDCFQELKKLPSTEQGAKFVTKPSPIRPLSARKPLGSSNVNNIGGTPTGRRVSTPMSRKCRPSSGRVQEAVKTAVAPANYVALPKDCSDNSFLWSVITTYKLNLVSSHLICQYSLDSSVHACFQTWKLLPWIV